MHLLARERAHYLLLCAGFAEYASGFPSAVRSVPRGTRLGFVNPHSELKSRHLASKQPRSITTSLPSSAASHPRFLYPPSFHLPWGFLLPPRFFHLFLRSSFSFLLPPSPSFFLSRSSSPNFPPPSYLLFPPASSSARLPLLLSRPHPCPSAAPSPRHLAVLRHLALSLIPISLLQTIPFTVPDSRWSFPTPILNCHYQSLPAESTLESARRSGRTSFYFI